jgi:hypothetical protein
MKSVIQAMCRTFENHLRAAHHPIESLNSSINVFIMKLVDWKQDRYTVFEVVENPSKHNKDFTIRARQNFLSYSNYAEKNIYDTGSFRAKEDVIKETFGMDYHKLNPWEKKMVWNSFIRRADLELVEEKKGMKLSELLGEEKLNEDQTQFKKTLTLGKLDTPSFRRYFVGGEYKMPLVMKFHAFKGEIIGLCFQLFSPTELNYAASLFMLPTRLLDNPVIDKKDPSKCSYSIAEYKKRYGLLGLMESAGYEQLVNSLVMDPKSSIPYIRRLEARSKQQVQVVSLDTVFNITSYLTEVVSSKN